MGFSNLPEFHVPTVPHSCSRSTVPFTIMCLLSLTSVAQTFPLLMSYFSPSCSPSAYTGLWVRGTKVKGCSLKEGPNSAEVPLVFLAEYIVTLSSLVFPVLMTFQRRVCIRILLPPSPLPFPLSLWQ